MGARRPGRGWKNRPSMVGLADTGLVLSHGGDLRSSRTRGDSRPAERQALPQAAQAVRLQSIFQSLRCRSAPVTRSRRRGVANHGELLILGVEVESQGGLRSFQDQTRGRADRAPADGQAGSSPVETRVNISTIVDFPGVWYRAQGRAKTSSGRAARASRAAASERNRSNGPYRTRFLSSLSTARSYQARARLCSPSCQFAIARKSES